MVITLTPPEALHLLEMILRHPGQDVELQGSLTAKVRSALLDVLEDHAREKTLRQFGDWAEKELDKIESLKTLNTKVQAPLRRSRKKS